MMTPAIVTNKKRLCFASKILGGDSCTSMNGIDGFSTVSKKLRTTLFGRSEITVLNNTIISSRPVIGYYGIVCTGSDGVGAMQNGHSSQLASQCGKSVALQ